LEDGFGENSAKKCDHGLQEYCAQLPQHFPSMENTMAPKDEHCMGFMGRMLAQTWLKELEHLCMLCETDPHNFKSTQDKSATMLASQLPVAPKTF
jgi:hypothetical protein